MFLSFVFCFVFWIFDISFIVCNVVSIKMV